MELLLIREHYIASRSAMIAKKFDVMTAFAGREKCGGRYGQV